LWEALVLIWRFARMLRWRRAVVMNAADGRRTGGHRRTPDQVVGHVEPAAQEPNMPHPRAFIIAAVTALSALAVPHAHSATTCASSEAPWPYYSGPGLGARNQTDTTVTAANAASLATAWSFDTADGGGGSIQSTPIVAGGCVIVTTDEGSIVALTLAGDLAWGYKVIPGGSTGLGGTIVGSPAVADGKVIVGVGRETTPFVLAVNLIDGSFAWKTTIDDHPGNFISASPVITGDLIFMGIAGDEYGADARGGYAFLDTDGTLVTQRSTISDAEYALGYRGSSIWSTGAYDPASKHVFVGGGNPATKTLEHRYSNALLKIDADPDSATFADIVDAYKGTVDQYYPGLDRQPVCEEFGEDQPNIPQYPWSLACVQFDVDFGASPSLWHDANGQLLMGDLQKSGIYHTVYADNMQLAWTSVMPGTPCFVCNASSPATDGALVYAVGSAGGALTAVTADGGKYRWVLPIADGVHFESVTTAGGVVYTTTSHGLLVAADAASGVPLSIKSFQRETGAFEGGLLSSGVSVAGNQVFAALGSTLLVLSPAA
jgi:outer membrane protein assembly factor BamB